MKCRELTDKGKGYLPVRRKDLSDISEKAEMSELSDSDLGSDIESDVIICNESDDISLSEMSSNPSLSEEEEVGLINETICHTMSHTAR